MDIVWQRLNDIFTIISGFIAFVFTVEYFSHKRGAGKVKRLIKSIF